ncbi:50S ribosomal protein L23 [Puniceicoccus vermicola]|uniref:Large ribosomal subunit protein uL23 n=1 Tax=Puniceicoccus vermicola TaxID=388746 RepID=A0A7X1E548_9BACT|nr:50S ribosomal protein L23 [Puniceicoccus vermicola]MBC2603275.1 50S ribosomal protein L23 [Puniceicoccus vermicola]
MIEPSKVLKESRVTEKATNLTANLNQYTFEVFPDATRTQVKQAVEQVFKVDVAKVNVLNVKPRVRPDRMRRNRAGRVSGMKKAIVTLKEGSSIEMI